MSESAATKQGDNAGAGAAAADALDDLPVLHSLHGRWCAQPYAEVKATGFLLLTLVVGVVGWSAVTKPLLANPLLLLVVCGVWFVTIRHLAVGGSARALTDGPRAVDLTGHTVVVTGGTSGIGLESCVVLARLGAQLILGVRSVARAERDTRRDIAQRAAVAPERIALYELDLSSQQSVRAFARAVLAENKPLALLLNNAAAGPTVETVGGSDCLVATNHLGPMLLTLLLAPNLKRAGGRVVNVASGASDLVPPATTVETLLARDKTGTDKFQVYAQSKVCNMLFTVELQRRLWQSGSKATAYSVHPGSIRTRLLRREGALFQWLLRAVEHVLFKTPLGGAQTSLYCALSPAARPGAYHADNRVVTPVMRSPRDRAFYAAFWHQSLAQIDGSADLPKVELPVEQPELPVA